MNERISELNERISELREVIDELNSRDLSSFEKVCLVFLEAELQEKEEYLDSQKWRVGLSDAARLKIWELQNEVEKLKSASA